MSSASRVLTGHPDVSASMRLRVLAAASQLGYQPDFLAQSLRSGETMTVGFVLPTISNTLVGELALGAEEVLRVKGYTMVVLNSEWDPALDARHIRMLEHRRADGVLVSIADESDPDTLRALRELSAPWVACDRDLSEQTDGGSVVLVEHETPMREVMSHLANLGHRTVGLVVGAQRVRPGRSKTQAFIQFCAEHGIQGLVEPAPVASSADHGYTATTRLVSGSPRPTALVCGSNELFPGMLRAIRAQGLVVPHDISLVTFDDMALLDLVDPPIDVVGRLARETGRTAAELLLRRVAGGGPETATIPSTFLRRGSSAAPAQRRKPAKAPHKGSAAR